MLIFFVPVCFLSNDIISESFCSFTILRFDDYFFILSLLCVNAAPIVLKTRLHLHPALPAPFVAYQMQQPVRLASTASPLRLSARIVLSALTV